MSGSDGEPTEQSADSLTDPSGRALGPRAAETRRRLLDVERAQLVETTARVLVQILTGRSAGRA